MYNYANNLPQQGWGANFTSSPELTQDQWDMQQMRNKMGRNYNYKANYPSAAQPPPPGGYAMQQREMQQLDGMDGLSTRGGLLDPTRAAPPPPGGYGRAVEQSSQPSPLDRWRSNAPPPGAPEVPDFVRQGTANYQAANATQQGAQGPQPGVTVPQQQRMRPLPAQGFGRPLW